MTDQETLTTAYLEAVYFAEAEEGETELTPYHKARAYQDCKQFHEDVRSLGLTLPWKQAGHDLLFTRQGHGVGFWSRDLEVYGNESVTRVLYAIAKAMDQVDFEFEEEGESK